MKHENHSRAPQHHTGNNQRRALTPNPEMSSDINPTLQPRRAVTPSGELTWWDENIKEPPTATQNAPTKENSATNNSGTLHEAYQKLHHIVRNPEQSYILNTNATDCNTSLKNRLMARLSVPNCTFYSTTSHPPKPNASENSSFGHQETLHQPASKANENAYANNSPIPHSQESSLDTTYISRQAVENVLKLQRQRSINTKAGHPFVGQRNSSSSLESLDNVFSLRDKGLPNHLKFDMPDGANVARRRDSGNWSGDRNSASSSSTTSLDTNPYFYVVGNKR